jgi:hypothetical protein
MDKRIFQMSSIGIINTPVRIHLVLGQIAIEMPAKKMCCDDMSIAASSIHPSVGRPCDMSKDLSHTTYYILLSSATAFAEL